ncbi:CHRD domain-containing protein [Jongsikchunia kroppenstedtii]|uniref:CHRD domain-containing protein n=1 Tax=Jongsikchunia kroppenstedtii TaxID=1121721 RepID=UPI00036B6655|nr:CHRD domain-containing protein [Jongsikchunia kroppenstedtii]
MAAAGLLALAACSSSSSHSSSSSTSSAGASPPTIPTVQLTPAPTGTVSLKWDPTTQLVSATIDMSGFTPGGAHAMHIHPGTCADQTKPPSVPFADITADSFGVIKQTVESKTKVPDGIPDHSYLNIHLAPMAQLGSPQDVSFTSISCADITPGSNHAAPVQLTMMPSGRNGKSITGSTTLSYVPSSHQLTVGIKATGLPPNTVHAAHIHDGSCVQQGAVAYSLPDLKADASGNAAETTTISVSGPPPATGWYVNVHFGSMQQILQDGKPTMLFAPILCGDIHG